MTQGERRSGGQAARGDELRVRTEGSCAELSLRLIQSVYRTSLDTRQWPAFLRELGEIIEDAVPVVLRSSPTDPSDVQAICLDLDEEFQRHVREKFGPRVHSMRYLDRFTKGFIDVGEIYPEVSYADTREYRDWLAPRGIAPIWPVAYTLTSGERRPMLGIALFRRGEPRPFRPDEIALLDSLVPHLTRAHDIRHSLGEAQRARLALGEVMDRLSPGVIFIDERCRVVATNRSANQILGLHDGLLVESETLRATGRREHERLREVLRDAVEHRHRGLLSIPRSLGRPSLTLYVTPLLDGPAARRERDPVALVLIGDPVGGRGNSLNVALRSLYDLTPAECELVSLLTQGRSLREIAAERGSTLNTVRTQLRRAFRKTGTRRQGDLVKLALTGLPGATDET